MNNNVKISPQQLFCVLMLSRLSSEMVYPRTSAGTASESALALLISEGVRFLLALPVIIYSFGGSNFHRAVWKKNKIFGWAGAVGAAILLIFAASHTLFNTAQFSIKSIHNGGTLWILLIIAAAFAIYAAYMGVEALARTSSIVLICAGIVTVVVLLCSIPQIIPESFAAMDEEGDFTTLFADVINRLMRGGDYLIFAALLPYVSTEKTTTRARCVLLFALFSAVGTLGVLAMNCLVLRQVYGLCEYPILATASLADIAFFKRLDGLLAAFWVLGAAIRAGLMLVSAKCALRAVIRAQNPPKESEAAR